MREYSTLGILILLMISLVVPEREVSSQSMPLISVSSNIVSKGEVFDILISITDAVNIGHIAFDITYDPEMLLLDSPPSLCSLAIGSLFATNPEVFPSGSGKLRVVIINSGGIDNSGDILKLKFVAAEDASGETLVEIIALTLSNTDLIDVSASTKSGTVTVSDILSIQSFNTVDLVITDPLGRLINKDFSQIPSSGYTEEDLNGDSKLDDNVIISLPILGDYLIQVLAEQGANPLDTYSINVDYNGDTSKLAENIRIQDIPAEPYRFFFRHHRMEKGWNLVSIPVQLPSNDLMSVLQSIAGQCRSVWHYENTGIGGEWKRYIVDGPEILNNLNTISSGKGYWVQMSDVSTLNVNGDLVDTYPAQLREGWNMVGYSRLTAQSCEMVLSSMNGKCSSIWGYDSKSQEWEKYVLGNPEFINDLEIAKPGAGYWMYAIEDCQWDANNTALVAPYLAAGIRRKPIITDRPEIPYVIWGSVEINGVQKNAIHQEPVLVVLECGNEVRASYQLGSVKQYGDFYVLDVPHDINFRSDKAEIYVQFRKSLSNATFIPSGEPGQAIRLNLYLEVTPEVSLLHQNYPNPFNPDTWIPYQLKNDANITISIYSVTGQLVRALNLGYKPAGFYTDKKHSAYWDGRNEAGELVASGIYFYNINAGEFSDTKKMVIAH